MKVLWFTNTPANGAAFLNKETIGGGWLQGLNEEMEEKVDLHIAFLNPNGPRSFSYGKTNYYSIMPSRWKYRLVVKALLGKDLDWNDTNEYMRIISQVKPDLIHIFGTESGFINILGKSDILTLVSLQGILTSILNKYNSGFDDKILKRVVIDNGFTIKNFFPRSYYHAKKILQKNAKREYGLMPLIKFIDGRTEWDRLTCSILSPDAKYFHVDRILRKEFYQHIWCMPSNPVFRIHTTTSNNSYKGFETICEALYELNRQNLKVEWTIAGINSNDSAVKAAKIKLGKRYPEDGLVFLGKLSSLELVKVMLESNLYVMTSHIENSPNNLAEAMLMGLPCISSFAGGSGSYIQNGVDGILIQDGDPWVLAGAIKELFNDQKKAMLYSLNAREKAQIRHNRLHISKRLYEIYNELVSINKQQL